MKKGILSFVVFFMLFANGVFAQQGVLKWNPLSLIINCYNGSFEYVIKERYSAQLGGYFINFSQEVKEKNHFTYFKLNGFSFTPEFRYYIFKEAPNGLYVAPFLRYQNLLFKSHEELDTLGQTFTNDEKYRFQTLGGGFTLGYQWIRNGRYSIDVFVGPSYYFGTAKAGSNIDNDKFSLNSLGKVSGGFNLRWGFLLGIPL